MLRHETTNGGVGGSVSRSGDDNTQYSIHTDEANPNLGLNGTVNQSSDHKTVNSSSEHVFGQVSVLQVDGSHESLRLGEQA